MNESMPLPVVRGRRGAAASVDHLATDAALAVLAEGGTAADAAVAASAVLAVTTPNNCGMGGDLVALVHVDGDPCPQALLGVGHAPRGADPAALRAAGHTTMPFADDLRSVTVPGCVDAWLALHDRHGSLPLDRLLAPAADLATGGFPAAPLLAAMAPLVAGRPGADDLTAPEPLRPLDVVRRPGQARLLDAIAAGGRDGFYRGEFGAGLLELGPGLFTAEDLARPQATWADAVGLPGLGGHVWAAPPPSQAYLVPLLLAVAGAAGVPADPDDPAWPHLLLEAARLASRDRPAALHEHADGPALLDGRRIAEAAAAFRAERAGTGPAPTGTGDTVSLCVASGTMAVSLLQSNAFGFGSGLAEPRTGTFLHNRGIGFSLEPGHPAELGPGRRPPSTLSPVVVTGPDRRWRAAAATMGGDTQPVVLAQVLLRALGTGASPPAAVSAPRVVWAPASRRPFATWSEPDDLVVLVEGQAPPAWPDGLTARGHRVVPIAPFAHDVGHAQLLVRQPSSPAAEVLVAGTDPRSGAGGAAAR